MDNIETISISIHQPNGELLKVTSLSEVDEGKYQCTYRPKQAGAHVVDIEVAKSPVKENPFSVLCAEKVAEQSTKKRGYLNKQGGVRKNWKRRYFELDDTNLSYFEDKANSLSLCLFLCLSLSLSLCEFFSFSFLPFFFLFLLNLPFLLPGRRESRDHSCGWDHQSVRS